MTQPPPLANDLKQARLSEADLRTDLAVAGVVIEQLQQQLEDETRRREAAEKVHERVESAMRADLKTELKDALQGRNKAWVLLCVTMVVFALEIGTGMIGLVGFLALFSATLLALGFKAGAEALASVFPTRRLAEKRRAERERHQATNALPGAGDAGG